MGSDILVSLSKNVVFFRLDIKNNHPISTFVLFDFLFSPCDYLNATLCMHIVSENQCCVVNSTKIQ